jgi:hypothetical protein
VFEAHEQDIFGSNLREGAAGELLGTERRFDLLAPRHDAKINLAERHISNLDGGVNLDRLEL